MKIFAPRLDLVCPNLRPPNEDGPFDTSVSPCPSPPGSFVSGGDRRPSIRGHPTLAGPRLSCHCPPRWDRCIGGRPPSITGGGYYIRRRLRRQRGSRGTDFAHT